MIRKAIGKVTNTAKNIALGIAHSGPVEKGVRTVTKAAANAVEPGAGLIDKTIKGTQKAVKKATDANTYKKIGSAIEEGTGKAIKNVITDSATREGSPYKQIGKTHMVAANRSLFGDEMHRRVQTGLDTVAHIARGDSLLTGKQALVQSGGDNLLPMGLKATKFGVGLAATAQLAAGTPQAVKQWDDNRMGTNFDNQPTTSAPRVPSYANNGGATGDLVFALNNLRHGGMM